MIALLMRGTLLPLLTILGVAGGAPTSQAQGPASPVAPSPLIGSAYIDFSSDFRRPTTRGADQWPSTWASDGNIYAVWGDGTGWAGNSPSNGFVYMGVTRIEGSPPSLKGTDVWLSKRFVVADKDTFENKKPLAIVGAADGKMYMFWTTAGDGWDGSYAATSTDNGKSWSFLTPRVFSNAADRVIVAGIAQFGPGYTQMPWLVDGNFFYVYLAQADTYNDLGAVNLKLYLARVPKAHVQKRSMYSFFNGLDANRQPIWSSKITAKQPVLSDPAGIGYHVNVSFNYGIARFMLAKSHFSRGAAGGDLDGLSLLEGADLWGPFKTVYYGRFKDSFAKFTYQIPPKWMSADGLTLWLTYSGWPEYNNVRFVKTLLRRR